jgi:hypothetical protein
MNTDSQSASGAQSFTGLWHDVVAGVRANADDGLRRLGGLYWYSIYAWWRRAGLPANKAVFATEGSFERWLDLEPPRLGDAGALAMREWTIARIEDLAGRGVKLLGLPPLGVDAQWAEERYTREPEGAPDGIFHRRWALTVL